jgi:hypothetical protein
MSRRLLIFVIVLVSIALGGIIYVQLYYIKNAYAQNELHFDEKVNAALNDLVDKLEQRETVDIIHEELNSRKKSPKTKPIQKVDRDVEVVVGTPRVYQVSDFVLTHPVSDSILFVNFNDSLFHTLVVSDTILKSGISWTASTEEEVIVLKDKSTNRIDRNYLKFKGKAKQKEKEKRKTVSSYSWSSTDDSLLLSSNEYDIVQNNIFVDDEGNRRTTYTYKVGNEETIRIEKKFIDKKADQIKQ